MAKPIPTDLQALKLGADWTTVTDTKKRILALDVGDARIGVAVSDETRLIAQTLAVVERSAGHPASRIVQLARENAAGSVVVGMPKNMDGTLGPQARKAQKFAQQLGQLAPELEILYWDERLSTFQARAMLIETGARKKQRQKPVDALSAAIILQAYLDHLRARASFQEQA